MYQLLKFQTLHGGRVLCKKHKSSSFQVSGFDTAPLLDTPLELKHKLIHYLNSVILSLFAYLLTKDGFGLK